MAMDNVTATNAYAAMARNMGNITPSAAAEVQGGDETSAAGGGDFMAMVRKAAETSIDTMKAGETASAQAVTGETSLPELVQAVSAAEMTLNTVVAVRDRMITAYQEIMRMPI